MNKLNRILCFGDSLTWGWVPAEDGHPTVRYDFEQRWPGVMQEKLGATVQVIEEGLSGRTTNIDDPLDDRLNGCTYLPQALASHLPLDVVILMLGTNDTKAYFNRSAFDISMGIAQLHSLIGKSAGGVGTQYPAPRVLLIAPPVLGDLSHPWQQAKFAGAKEKTQELGQLYAALADYSGIDFLNAGEVITTQGSDGIHLSAQNNIDLGNAMAERVLQMI